MKTVKQQAEVSFKLLDFADKVVMLPLMDKLSHALSSTGDLELRTDNACDVLIEKQHVEKMFKVLSDLGCRTSLGESYEDFIKSLDSQEKQERCILHLFDPGQSRLDVIKVIKDYLNVSTMEAQNIINVCPIDIDLRTFNITQNKYAELLKLLTEKGCNCSLKLNTDK